MDLPAVVTMIFLASVWVAEAICQKDTRRRRPIVTWTACGLLTMCLIAQLRFPQLLILFERNTTRILHGEWWRIVTALFFQDGWIVGGVTNIVSLFFIGKLVEQIRSRQDWLLAAFVGALAGELVALRWQPIGAGNSIATCSLAGFLIGVRPLSQMRAASKIPRIFAIAISLLLAADRDLHGVAGIVGILLGVLRSNHDLTKGRNA
jgi:rhomboid protease GluP